MSQSSAAPIGPYERRPVVLQPWDPAALIVADRVAAIVHGERPDLRVEHIGSTAVPGLPGKGIVDLGAEAEPDDIPAITEAMFGLGFGPQPGPKPWPPTRPMHVGSYVLGGREYRVHLHIHPLGGDLEHDLRFREALRSDPRLATAYAQVKDEVLAHAEGPLDHVDYQTAKGRWIDEAYVRLGIPLPEPASTMKERGS